MKFLIKWVYLCVRAFLRWTFIDMNGEGYFKKRFVPSSETGSWFSYGPEYDPEGVHDEFTRGENVPAIVVPFYIVAAVISSPLWIPCALVAGLWFLTTPLRTGFHKWIGDVDEEEST